jgi:uncharacterized protein YutE (UPF0331/DUF86 family)
VVDPGVLAFKVAAIRDAVARIREALPSDVEKFAGDRTAREIVALNLLVAIQEALDLATHWLADAGWEVPSSHRGVFEALARHGALDEQLASRLGAAAGLRNLIAHRYAVLDWRRLHEVAATDLGDLDELCALAARRAADPT